MDRSQHHQHHHQHHQQHHHHHHHQQQQRHQHQSIPLYELLFKKIFKNSVLFNHIFSFIRGTGTPYYKIFEVGWMLKCGHLGLLVDKIHLRELNGSIHNNNNNSKSTGNNGPYRLRTVKSTGDEHILELFFKRVKSFKEFLYIYTNTLTNCSSMVILSCHQPNIEIVDYLYREKEAKAEAIFHSKGIYNAAKHGYLDVIKYMTEKEKLFPSYDFSFIDDKLFAIDIAAEHRHFEVVKWLHYNRLHIKNCSSYAMECAARKGYLEIVQFLHEHRKEGPSKNTMVSAASQGHLEIVQYLHENIPTIHCTQDAVNYAAENGHTQVVHYLLTHRKEGCTSYAIEFASLNGHFDIVKLFSPINSAQATVNACINNHYDIAEFLIKTHRLLPTPHGFDYTCFKGNYAIVQLLHESGATCTKNAMDLAAQMGHLEIVEFLHLNRKEGCTTNAMDLAALGGYSQVVHFLHGNRLEGCSTNAIDNAALRGHLDIVQFLVANNYPYKNALLNAMEYSKKEVFNFLYQRLDLKSSSQDKKMHQDLVKRSQLLPSTHDYRNFFRQNDNSS
ncbi:hypothetical protein CYY_003844 [Polysphondylium violaceum]|uniref:Ankyrin repeat-containing protein n=1 Tax=Polysphondylium violaceum TaxID=133409 RepID=A0A8J4PWD4_9MYCE|nr:hypothetical protein CYY_003844 [Polysphondylium violaceum]